MIRNRVLLFVALLALPIMAGEPSIDDLAWMAGAWRSDAGGMTSEEVWTTPAGGMLLGLHRDVTKKRAAFEFLRIAETDDGIVYYGSPGGRPPTPFRLTESKPMHAIFENPEHDFPKRILYWRDADRLCARVDAGAETEGEEWCWERLKIVD